MSVEVEDDVRRKIRELLLVRRRRRRRRKRPSKQVGTSEEASAGFRPR